MDCIVHGITKSWTRVSNFHKFAKTLDNLEEMHKSLERYNLPRLNQEEIEDIDRPIMNTEIKTVIKNLPIIKSQGPDGFIGKLYQTFREELTPYPSETLSKKLQRKKHPLTHSMRPPSP